MATSVLPVGISQTEPLCVDKCNLSSTHPQQSKCCCAWTFCGNPHASPNAGHPLLHLQQSVCRNLPRTTHSRPLLLPAGPTAAQSALPARPLRPPSSPGAPRVRAIRSGFNEPSAPSLSSAAPSLAARKAPAVGLAELVHHALCHFLLLLFLRIRPLQRRRRPLRLPLRLQPPRVQRYTCDCPRVDLDRQWVDGDHADILEMVGDRV